MSIQNLIQDQPKPWLNIRVNSIENDTSSFFYAYNSQPFTYPPITGSSSILRPFLVKDSESSYFTYPESKLFQVNSISNYQSSGYTLFYLQNLSPLSNQKMMINLFIQDQATGPITPFSVIYDLQLFKGSNSNIPDTPIQSIKAKALSTNSGVSTVILSGIFDWSYNDTIWFFVNNPGPIPMDHSVLSMQFSLFSLEN